MPAGRDTLVFWMSKKSRKERGRDDTASSQSSLIDRFLRFLSAHRIEAQWSLVLLAACLAVYYQAGAHSFLNWGDDTVIYGNSALENGITWESVKWAFANRDGGLWQPLTWLTYMWHIGWEGPDPSTYHWLSIVLHSFNVLLLFAVLRVLSGALWRSAVAALLFAVHPLLVEGVAWASQLHLLQGLFFALLSLWCHGCFMKGQWPRGNYVLSIVFLTAALLHYPLLFAFPLLFFLLRREGGSSLEKMPHLVLGALAAVMVALSPRGVPEDLAALVTQIPALQAIPAAVAVYVAKLFWPANLVAAYPAEAYATPLFVGAGAALLVIVTALAIWQRRERPWVATGWFWFLLATLPAVAARNAEGAPFADGNVYAGLPGLAIVLCWAIPSLTGEALFARTPVRVAVGLLVAALLGRAYIRAADWQDALALWEKDSRRIEANDLLHYQHARTLEEFGRAEEAIPILEEIVKRRPDFGAGLNKLAAAQMRTQRDEEGEKNLEEALRVSPNDGNVWYNRGIQLKNKDQYEEAEAAYRKAIELGLKGKTLIVAHDDLGVVLTKQVRLEEGLAEFEKALKLDPHFTNARRNRAITLFNLGRMQEAETEFAAIVARRPEDQTAQKALKFIRSGGQTSLE